MFKCKCSHITCLNHNMRCDDEEEEVEGKKRLSEEE